MYLFVRSASKLKCRRRPRCRRPIRRCLPEARLLVLARERAWLRSRAEFAMRLNERETLEGVDFSVASNYFLVDSSVRMEGAGQACASSRVSAMQTRLRPIILAWYSAASAWPDSRPASASVPLAHATPMLADTVM